MATKYYSIPLIFKPRIDNPKENFRHPEVSKGLTYNVRHFNSEKMLCKIEVEESEIINNGIEIDYAT